MNEVRTGIGRPAKLLGLVAMRLQKHEREEYQIIRHGGEKLVHRDVVEPGSLRVRRDQHDERYERQQGYLRDHRQALQPRVADLPLMPSVDPRALD